MITALILIPAIAALVAAADSSRDAALAKRLAVAVGFVCTIASAVMYASMFGKEGLQFVEKIPWITSLGVQYFVGLDGLSIPFVVLTALLTAVSVMASWDIKDRSFFALFLALQSIVTGVFAAHDLVLFIFLFEISLVPMFFIIGNWGYENRRYAAIKFVLYSLTGGVIALVSILALAYAVSKQAGIPLTFDYEILRAHLPAIAATPGIALIFWGMMLAFLIKLPAFPVHTWLPHAHTEAPTAGSIVLAGVLLKMGGYAIVRFNVGLMPQQMQQFQSTIATIAAIGVIYGAYVALNQRDLKRMVANSSVNHMGYVLLGIASLTPMGIHGAMYQMVAHGLITGLMFMTVGFLSHRTHTREIAAMRGMYNAMPVLGAIMWAAFLGGLGLPGMAGFIGEYTALQGAFQNPNTICQAVASLIGIMVTAGFTLWAIQRVLLGKYDGAYGHAPNPEANDHHSDGGHDHHIGQAVVHHDAHAHGDHNHKRGLFDLSALEIGAAAPLLILAVILGLYPALLTPLLDAGLQPLVETVRAVATR